MYEIYRNISRALFLMPLLTYVTCKHSLKTTNFRRCRCSYRVVKQRNISEVIFQRQHALHKLINFFSRVTIINCETKSWCSRGSLIFMIYYMQVGTEETIIIDMKKIYELSWGG